VVSGKREGGQRLAAYNELREMILDLRLPPGAVVNEQSLANELGYGRMPIHEAIARLAGERFITVLPRRGTVVTAFALQDVLDMFDARQAVEGGIAYLAASRATDVDLATLRKLVKSAGKARKGVHPDEFLAEDMEIHSYLARITKNSFLQDTADLLLLHNLRFWRSHWSTRPPQQHSMMSHEDLLHALEAREPEQAQEAMRAHIASSRQLLQSLF
jgi:DNA-binding GntR family transcriptional regulator